MIALFLWRVVGVGVVTVPLLDKILGLAIHPLMHARWFMCSLHAVYKWKVQLPKKGVVCLPKDVREELFICGLFVLIAECDLRVRAVRYKRAR